ncbi:gamma-mobile-trio protein GmtX [Iodobacter sp.]|uniref:gamma-mobile-trio protein GmtX n=1 Tax=Iodobacter sp. TaxID=1915058 RepID=UPI0025F1AC73|nr:gamma-mobile-trio protein GmtX [Iodobacter sp.]
MQNANPKQLLENFIASASARKKLSLQTIYDICIELEKKGGKFLTIATVGRMSHERGGPAEPAIRNAAGEHYRLLIQAFVQRSEQGEGKKKGQSAKLDEIFEGIPDPVLRARIGLLLAELSSLRAQLLASRHLANQISTINLTNHTDNSTQTNDEQNGLHLSLQELSALEAAISSDTLEHWGWLLEQNGRVSSESGQIIFRAGFVSAIKKIISIYGV